MEKVWKFRPEEILSKICATYKRAADRRVGEKAVQSCVVTIPAYFDREQRLQTLKACKLANLNVVRFLEEPLAAAICQGLTF